MSGEGLEMRKGIRKAEEARRLATKIQVQQSEPRAVKCHCSRCGKALSTASTGNFFFHDPWGWFGVCLACVRPEED